METTYFIITAVVMGGAVIAFLVGAFRSTRDNLDNLNDKYESFIRKNHNSHGGGHASSHDRKHGRHNAGK